MHWDCLARIICDKIVLVTASQITSVNLEQILH